MNGMNYELSCMGIVSLCQKVSRSSILLLTVIFLRVLHQNLEVPWGTDSVSQAPENIHCNRPPEERDTQALTVTECFLAILK